MPIVYVTNGGKTQCDSDPINRTYYVLTTQNNEHIKLGHNSSKTLKTSGIPGEHIYSANKGT
jgi:hypothetical protein